MKITEVRVIVTCPGRNYVFVKVMTDVPGLYGVGEGTLNGSEPIVAELRSITEEIDDLTKAILDTITLETALKSTRLREKTTAGAGGS